jgi:hypothetical protein
VKSFGHGVLDEFLDQVAKMPIAENHKLIQALVLDGFDKSFRVGIAIWALRWDFHALHAPSFEDRDERLREQGIPIVDQVLCSSQKSIWSANLRVTSVTPLYSRTPASSGRMTAWRGTGLVTACRRPVRSAPKRKKYTKCLHAHLGSEPMLGKPT